jgi:hypothetical protein
MCSLERDAVSPMFANARVKHFTTRVYCPASFERAYIIILVESVKTFAHVMDRTGKLHYIKEQRRFFLIE